jgi:hypothetical protein
MADISTYPLATPKATDLVLGTQTNALGTNHTKSFTVGSIADKVPSIQLGYTSLVQLVTQASTAAPVAVEVYNNTGQTYTWTRTSAGTFRITATNNPFTFDKTVVFVNAGKSENIFLPIYWEYVNTNTIDLLTYDNELENASFEIKIYN